ncbi:MAG: HAMP domain-containing histidine kinase [Bacteroidales bacterium]|nr:HAMP domain-containing histidine kinase [Bacteroidales bacterium]
MQTGSKMKELIDEIELLRAELEKKDKILETQNNFIRIEKETMERQERLLHSLVEAAAGKIGQDFFDNIVTKLAEWLNADCVIIGQKTEDERINAVPMYFDGQISHGFSYELEGSPCDVTTRTGYCAYSENVINLFPKDKILIDFNAESYIGTALYNKSGDCNGVICSVSRKKLTIPPNAKEILKIIGARVSAEIERKKIEEALLKSESDLRVSNATKDKFFSIIAHDLKNPMNTIIGFSELLAEGLGKMNDEQIEFYVDIIGQSSKNAFDLLENLLVWSLSQQGLIRFNPRKFNVNSEIHKSIALVNNMAIKKSISIQVNINKILQVVADRNLFGTIIRNLLSNAIKFTNPGGAVKVYTNQFLNPAQNKVEIIVEDNGVGMNADKLKTIFSVGKSTPEQGTDYEKGTGLGLILCKEFAEKNEGSIHVESKLGKGSKFIVTLNTI